MKKILTSILITAFILSFASCGTTDKGEPNESNGISGNASSQTAEQTTASYTEAESSETELSGGRIWKLSENGTLTIYEDIVMNDDPGEQIPWSSKKERIKNVIIKSNVSSIGYHAFEGCKSLKSIKAEDGSNSFSSLDGVLFDKDKTTVICAPAGKDLGSYAIPDSVTAIAESAFHSCRLLTEITIPNSVKSIGNYAFLDCTSLTEVSVPESVTSIGDWAFLNCVSLKSISIPDTVTYIGNGIVNNTTFFNGEENRKDGVLYIGKHLINADYNISGEISIKQGTLTIAGMAFSGSSSLSGVTIPDSVRTIGTNAFSVCTSLQSITIPCSVTYIGDYAFMGCDALTTIDVDENSKDFSSVDGVLFNKEKTDLLCFPAGKGAMAYTVPEGVTSVADNAFSFCAVTSIVIPSGVVSIGDSAFYDCEGLEEITISDTVKSLGKCAFYNCCSLKSITIPESVISIGDYAFSECSSEFVIICTEGSYAEQYAKDNDIAHSPLN